MRYVALLRGINVGGRRKVSMVDLAEVTRGLGYGEVRTHVNSGNLLLTATETEAEVVERLEGALSERFGFAIRLVVRDSAAIVTVAGRDPFPGRPTVAEHVYVTFLDRPASPDVAALAGPAVLVEGREVYALLDRGAMAKGGGPMAAIEKAVGRVTTRNMTTVRKLAEMTGE